MCGGGAWPNLTGPCCLVFGRTACRWDLLDVSLGVDAKLVHDRVQLTAVARKVYHLSTIAGYHHAK